MSESSRVEDDAVGLRISQGGDFVDQIPFLIRLKEFDLHPQGFSFSLQ